MNDVIPLLKFTPSAQDPKILETITVQREPLIVKLVESALDTGGGLRHQLLIGPRGMGKTHILSLVASRVSTERDDGSIVIAWLDEDPWAVRTYEKFIAAIVAAAAEELGDEEMAARAAEMRAADDSGGLVGQELLRAALGERRLLLLAENLDQVFRRIGADGQAKFRAFAEDWRQMLILATAPQIFEGIQLHESPFYGFFAITHLQELSLASAAELMKRVATLRGDSEVLRFLATKTAAQRLAAIEALAGGHPRIWLLLSGCVSIAAIEELVPMFLEALDELTPYYQDRLRELGDQQQELIVLLSEDGGALSNRVLAERSGIRQNQVASMLGDLAEGGYVRRAKVPAEFSGGDSRLSFWELREPLMRLCLDVKQARGKPLRMVVEFLRAWYGPSLLDELIRLPPSAQLATTYASEAFRMLGDELTPDDLFQGRPEDILARAERGLSLLPESEGLKIAKATGLAIEGRNAEARELLEELIDPGAVDLANAELRVQLAFVLRALGEKVEVETLFAYLGRLQDANPDVLEVMVLSAFAYDGFDRFAEALRAYDRALELDPDDADLHDKRGLALRNLGRLEEAASAFSRAIELDPASAISRRRRAAALGGLGRVEEALSEYLAASELDPENVDIHNNRGALLGRSDRHEEALEAFRLAAELDPENASVRRNLGTALRHLGRHEEALEALAIAADLDPENAGVYNERGVVLGRLGRAEASLSAFARAIELDPHDPAVLSNYGVSLGIAGRYDEALPMVREAAELDPDNAVIQSNYGVGLNNVGRFEEAVGAYDRAIELAPSAGIHEKRGAALRNLGRDKEALEAFTKASELDPEDRDARLGAASMLLALGRGEEALETFREDAELNAADAGAHERLGRMLASLGRHEEALDAFTRASELEPESSAAHNLRADELRELGSWEEAEIAARLAIELDPADPIPLFTFAEMLLARGDREAGLARLRNALELWRTEKPAAPPGEPDLLCRILWQSYRNDPTAGELIAAIVQAYDAIGAPEALGRGIVSSIPLFVDDAVSPEEATAWVENWTAASSRGDIEIPLSILRAARQWKQDEDRAHILALPPEQREILIGLLESTGKGGEGA